MGGVGFAGGAAATEGSGVAGLEGVAASSADPSGGFEFESFSGASSAILYWTSQFAAALRDSSSLY